MMDVDKIVLGVLLLSVILSFAFTKFKGSISRVLFVNLISYPIASIVAIIILSFFVEKNFILAIGIDFVYSLLIVVPVTLIIFGLSYIIKHY